MDCVSEQATAAGQLLLAVFCRYTEKGKAADSSLHCQRPFPIWKERTCGAPAPYWIPWITLLQSCTSLSDLTLSLLILFHSKACALRLTCSKRSRKLSSTRLLVHPSNARIANQPGVDCLKRSLIFECVSILWFQSMRWLTPLLFARIPTKDSPRSTSIIATGFSFLLLSLL